MSGSLLGLFYPILTVPGISRKEDRVRNGSQREFLKSVLLVTVLAGGVRIAEAHAKLVRSTPKDGATLRASPKRIELWFNELLDDEFNTAQVFSARDLSGKDRKELAQQKPQVDKKDRTHLSLNLPPLEPGKYAVEY